MDIFKVFYDEPAALGSVGSDLPEPVSRLYLAGTRLPDAPADVLRVGLTALDAPGVFVRPLLGLLDGLRWTRVGTDGTLETITDAAPALAAPAGIAALVASAAALPAGLLASLAESSGRDALPALVAVLGVARAVLMPEPAHDGYDWSVWACGPLRAAFAEQLRGHPAPGARRFVVPFRRARGEHHFYFEQWQLDALPPHVEEV